MTQEGVGKMFQSGSPLQNSWLWRIFYTISDLSQKHKLDNDVYAMTSLLKITFNMQHYNTVYACFCAGIEGIPQTTAKGGWSAARRSSRAAFITWRVFSRRKNNTQIVSFVLFVFLQWGIKSTENFTNPVVPPSSMILVCPHVRNAALILSGGKTAIGKSTLLEGIRQKSHLTCEWWSTWIWVERKLTERLSWWCLALLIESICIDLKRCNSAPF